jgi:hypothetical protein
VAAAAAAGARREVTVVVRAPPRVCAAPELPGVGVVAVVAPACGANRTDGVAVVSADLLPSDWFGSVAALARRNDFRSAWLFVGEWDQLEHTDWAALAAQARPGLVLLRTALLPTDSELVAQSNRSRAASGPLPVVSDWSLWGAEPDLLGPFATQLSRAQDPQAFLLENWYRVLPWPSAAPWIDRFRCPDIASSGKRHAFATMLSTTNHYVLAAAVLGLSLMAFQNDTARILIHQPGALSRDQLHMLTLCGWQPCAIPYIPPPDPQRVYWQYVHQYTKLSIWSWTAFDRVVFVDADSLVRAPMPELFQETAPFAASPNLRRQVGVALTLNGGFLSVRPSLQQFWSLWFRSRVDLDYDLALAEQAFLNKVFPPGTWKDVGYCYGANVALKVHEPVGWDNFKSCMKSFHFIRVKPSDPAHRQHVDYPRMVAEIHEWRAYLPRLRSLPCRLCRSVGDAP